jgi:hypothetical protein
MQQPRALAELDEHEARPLLAAPDTGLCSSILNLKALAARRPDVATKLSCPG